MNLDAYLARLGHPEPMLQALEVLSDVFQIRVPSDPALDAALTRLFSPQGDARL